MVTDGLVTFIVNIAKGKIFNCTVLNNGFQSM